jgi:hypothetical protein
MWFPRKLVAHSVIETGEKRSQLMAASLTSCVRRGMDYEPPEPNNLGLSNASFDKKFTSLLGSRPVVSLYRERVCFG